MKKRWLIMLTGLLLAGAVAAFAVLPAIIAPKAARHGSEAAGRIAEPANPPEVTIGSKSFTEQYLLMKMTSILLREHGFRVNEIIFKGSRRIREAMEAGVIDQYWEYPNTALVYYHNRPAAYHAEKALREAAEADERLGIRWLPINDINNTWVVLISRALSEKHSISTISDLAEYANRHHIALRVASNSEFLVRQDGMNNFEQTYGLSIPRQNVIVTETSLFAQAVKEARVDASIGFAMDGRIREYDLVALEDNLRFFPPYNPAPVVQAATLEQYPQIGELLTELTRRIDNERMMHYLYRADVLHDDVTELARQYLLEMNLIE